MKAWIYESASRFLCIDCLIVNPGSQIEVFIDDGIIALRESCSKYAYSTYQFRNLLTISCHKAITLANLKPGDVAEEIFRDGDLWVFKFHGKYSRRKLKLVKKKQRNPNLVYVECNKKGMSLRIKKEVLNRIGNPKNVRILASKGLIVLIPAVEGFTIFGGCLYCTKAIKAAELKDGDSAQKIDILEDGTAMFYFSNYDKDEKPVEIKNYRCNEIARLYIKYAGILYLGKAFKKIPGKFKAEVHDGRIDLILIGEQRNSDFVLVSKKELLKHGYQDGQTAKDYYKSADKISLFF